MRQVDCIWPLAADLGEGPVWVAREQALWFVDIYGCRIHRFHPASGERRSWPVDNLPSFILPAVDGRFVVGTRHGLHRFDPRSGMLELLTAVEPHLPGNRLNDASVGPDGMLWFGSMDDAQEASTGAFYRLGADGGVETLIDGCGITNGPAVTADGRIFYHTDSAQGTIYAADLAADGSLSGRRVFARVDPADGTPDGSILDSEGCLWVGLWGGWRARRYAADGSIVDEVRLPTANVTKIALGGPDLRTAYVTTARRGLTEAELQDQPLAGALFAFDVDVPGVATAELAIEIRPGRAV